MINAKDRMKEFNKLPSNTIPWETFKRLVGQFGLEKAIEKSQQIIKKRLDKQG
jgi:hypothetical protein|tara:strand:+ start:126 stop:284 length:159 start_codon:yes stop_codon:yes gene_type:complete